MASPDEPVEQEYSQYSCLVYYVQKNTPITLTDNP